MEPGSGWEKKLNFALANSPVDVYKGDLRRVANFISADKDSNGARPRPLQPGPLTARRQETLPLPVLRERATLATQPSVSLRPCR